VDRIITDLAVIDVVAAGEQSRLVLRELAPNVSIDDVTAATGVELFEEDQELTV
jgi:3-oxoacid CoA-transferase subunit B